MNKNQILEKLEELESEVRKHEERLSSLENRAEVVVTKEDKPLSLPEFMMGRNTRYHKDKALRIGYFLEHYRNKDSFTVSDVEEGYSRCRFKKPANMSDILAKAAADGLFVEIGEEDGAIKWALTGSGENIVEEERVHE